MAGVKGRSGRKPKYRILQFNDLINEYWPTADRIAVVQQLQKAAIAGDVEAAKVLLFMTFGRPRQQLELSGPGGQALEIGINASEQLKRKLANLAQSRGFVVDR
jgi:hypothetical protein